MAIYDWPYIYVGICILQILVVPNQDFDICKKQAGTELGQAQLKLELYYILIFWKFGLIELTGWYINYLDCMNWRNQLCFLHNQNLSWIGRAMTKIEI